MNLLWGDKSESLDIITSSRELAELIDHIPASKETHCPQGPQCCIMTTLKPVKTFWNAKEKLPSWILKSQFITKAVDSSLHREKDPCLSLPSLLNSRHYLLCGYLQDLQGV